jgi:hypothetical protein
MGLALTTLGAVLTTLLGVLVGSILTNRSQTRQWSRDRQADACAQVLRESSNLLIELAKLHGQKVASVPDRVRIQTPLDWKPWNEALAMVNLVADHDIVAAAHAVDAEFWPVHQQVKRGWTKEGDWYKLRSPIEERRRDFVNVARKHLAPSGMPLRRLTGRPPDDDPFWELRRSYFANSGSQPGETPLDRPSA